jgi:hypothetical protein
VIVVENDRDEPLSAARETYVSSKPKVEYTHCSACQHVLRPFHLHCPRCEGERNRRIVDNLANVIRELKSGPVSTDRERELVKLLDVYGHPNKDGLLKAIEEKRAAPVKKKERYR